MGIYSTTAVEDIPRIREQVFSAFATGKTRDVEFRRTQLLQLAYMFQDNKQLIRDALAADLNRSMNETDFLEYMPILEQTLRAYESVKKWSKPESAPFTVNTYFMRPRTYKEPKGVALIIGPFNYPLFCVFIPMIGAIAAGCAIVVKPSEMSPHIAALLTELFPKYLDPTVYTIVNGAIPETTALLDLQWDHIFFTGGGRVAKVVSAAAAKHLTPLTLELGGKNPTIVDKDCDFDASARRILWAKSANAGQSCTAPDHILVVREAHEKLIAALHKAYKQFFPDPATQNADMSHVINSGAFKRVTDILSRTKGQTILGGASDASNNWIATTVVDGCKYDDALMEGEIFGPVLPIILVENVEEAVRLVNKGERPLGVYIFSKNQKVIDYVFANTMSGTVLANDSLIQPGVYGIPFGGTGASGYGYSGGKFAFDTFTHIRGSLQLPTWMEKIMAVRYHPHTPKKLSQMQTLIRTIPYARPGTGGTRPWGKLVASFALIVGVLAAYQAKRK